MMGPSERWTTTRVAVVQNASITGDDKRPSDEMAITRDCRMQRGDVRRRKAFKVRNVQVKAQKAWGFPIYRKPEP